MERIFLSYTYNPAAGFEARTDTLLQQIRVMIEAMDLTVVEGVDVGGRAIDAVIEERIGESDAIVVVMTPWTDDSGLIGVPPYLLTEFAIASTLGKPVIRLVHEGLPVDGMFTNNEYIPYIESEAINALLKLMRTVALWKKEAGKGMQIQLEPSSIGTRYDSGVGHELKYQLLLPNYEETDWRVARLWKEPGATYAFVPSVPDDSKLRLRLDLRNEIWDSEYSDSMGRVKLLQRGGN